MELVKKHNEVLVKTGIVLDGQSVYKNRTGWFNIKYFASLRGDYDEERANQLAEELGLTSFLNEKVTNLSYGTQKKLILLIALLNDPEVLILDEPFRGLDFDTIAWFKKYLKNLTTQGVTLLISSHVRNDLEALCDEVYVIDQGKIIEHIDLNQEKEKKLRIINTNNNQLVCQILDQAQYEYELTDDQKIKLDISHANWNDIYQSFSEQQIDIYEMSKVKILEDKLN